MDVASVPKTNYLKSSDFVPKRQQLDDLLAMTQPTPSAAGSSVAAFGASPAPAGASDTFEEGRSSMSSFIAAAAAAAAAVAAAAGVDQPPPLKYDYADIDHLNIQSTIRDFVAIDDALTLFKRAPQLKASSICMYCDC